MADHPDHGVARRLFAARLAASLMPLNSTMIAVAVPDIAGQLWYSRTAVTQALVASYLITAIALQSPGGKLGVRLGHWRVVTSARPRSRPAPCWDWSRTASPRSPSLAC